MAAALATVTAAALLGPSAADAARVDLRGIWDQRWLGAKDVGVDESAAPGDVNGDGLPDALIATTAPGNVPRFWILYGRRPAFRLTVALARAGTSAGYFIDAAPGTQSSLVSLANTGDVNGDGVPDQVIGLTPVNPFDRGQAFVVFGQRGSNPQPINLGALQPGQGYLVLGAPGDGLGGAVAGTGDVNGDGVPDQLVGAGQQEGSPGRAYVVYGQRAASPQTIDLGTLQPSQGYAMQGAPGDGAGQALAGAGDVNRDGVPDQLVGALSASHGAPDSGSAYVVYGRRSPNPGTIQLGSLGPSGYRLDGGIAFGLAAASVDNTGDVNGDGIPDQLIGQPGQTGEVFGSAYVVYGRGTPPGAAINLRRLGSNQGYRLRNSRPASMTGSAVAGAGDVNRDGVPDQLVGAPGAAPSGFAYVVYGQRGRLTPIDLARLPDSRGYGIGGVVGAAVGWSVASVGDLDGDGRPDPLVLAPNFSPTRNSTGAVYVVPALPPITTAITSSAAVPPSRRFVITAYCEALPRTICRGSLTLTAILPGSLGAVRLPITVAATAFRLSANRRTQLALSLSGQGAALLRRTGSLRVSARAATNQSLGRPAIARTRRITLRPRR
jgi:hypothetical protein